jgi:hypothetical protein
VLTIVIPAEDYYDDELEEFIVNEEVVLELEHSLASLSKWESTFEKPFLTREAKPPEEVFAYFEAMVLTPKFPRGIFARAPEEVIRQIGDYIDAKRSATWFNDSQMATGGSSETITSELVYYWMVSHKIPFVCESWHLNRLLTLIRVCNVKNGKQTKMTPSERLTQQRALNEQRRREFGTSG